MKRLWFALLFLSACNSETNDRIKLETEAELVIKQALRDPGSASFSREKTDLAHRVVCGEVNSKNGFGGLTGPDPFVYEAGTFATAASSPEAYKTLLPKCDGAVSRL